MNYKKRIKELEKRVAKLESFSLRKSEKEIPPAVQTIGKPDPMIEVTPQSFKAK